VQAAAYRAGRAGVFRRRCAVGGGLWLSAAGTVVDSRAGRGGRPRDVTLTGDITPPPLFCSKHPDGANGPCPACMDQRRIRKEWDYTAPGIEYRKRQAAVDAPVDGGRIAT